MGVVMLVSFKLFGKVWSGLWQAACLFHQHHHHHHHHGDDDMYDHNDDHHHHHYDTQPRFFVKWIGGCHCHTTSVPKSWRTKSRGPKGIQLEVGPDVVSVHTYTLYTVQRIIHYQGANALSITGYSQYILHAQSSLVWLSLLSSCVHCKTIVWK